MFITSISFVILANIDIDVTLLSVTICIILIFRFAKKRKKKRSEKLLARGWRRILRPRLGALGMGAI